MTGAPMASGAALQRTLFQVYVRDCDAAIERYQDAFGARCADIVRDPADGSVVHAELDVLGQVVALSERWGAVRTGNTMQFCFHLASHSEEFLGHAYRTLSVGAEVIEPLGPSFYSPGIFSLVDPFGVSWCLFL